jgi:hypothetical protein
MTELASTYESLAEQMEALATECDAAAAAITAPTQASGSVEKASLQKAADNARTAAAALREPGSDGRTLAKLNEFGL